MRPASALIAPLLCLLSACGGGSGGGGPPQPSYASVAGSYQSEVVASTGAAVASSPVGRIEDEEMASDGVLTTPVALWTLEWQSDGSLASLAQADGAYVQYLTVSADFTTASLRIVDQQGVTVGTATYVITRLAVSG